MGDLRFPNHSHNYLFSKAWDIHARLNDQIEHLNSIPTTGMVSKKCIIPGRQFPRNSECNVHQNINFQYLLRPHILGFMTCFLISVIAALCLSMCNVPDSRFARNTTNYVAVFSDATFGTAVFNRHI